MVVALSENKAFIKLQNDFGTKAKTLNMNNEFEKDPGRAKKYTQELLDANGKWRLRLDYSKNLIDDAILQQLFAIVSDSHL